MSIEDVRRRVYPEVHAGGFADNDGSILFYSRINALLEPHMTVLDYGAGRGVATLSDPCEYRRHLRRLLGKVERVIGVDVDLAVLTNNYVDEAYVIEIDGRLPFSDATFDVIVSDYVFEHVARPAHVAAELRRVLKPGGWILARTPNLFGYVALGTKLTPPFLRNAVLRRLNPNAGGKDNFPVKLRMNSKRALRRAFPTDDFEHLSYVRRFEGLGYFGRAEWLVRMARACMHFLPTFMGPEIIIVLRKRQATAAYEARDVEQHRVETHGVDAVESLIEPAVGQGVSPGASRGSGAA